MQFWSERAFIFEDKNDLLIFLFYKNIFYENIEAEICEI